MRQHPRGFVLVNALIIVAALAGAAVLLLSRAETGRVRLEARQNSAQLMAYLDGFEARAAAILMEDAALGPVDHAKEDWAKPDVDVAVDRGRVTGQITELQGLFNLNWLANSNRLTARETLDAMLRRKGLSSDIASSVAGYLASGGPDNRSGFATQTPPLDPVGGALLVFDQLADIPALDAEKRTALRGFATVLPGGSTVNVNTALPDLMIGLLPQVQPGAMNQLLARRQVDPFTSIEAFAQEVQLLVEEPLEDFMDVGQFSVGSEWFRVEMTATLNGLQASRTVVLRRLGATQGVQTHWRITRFP